MPSPVRLLNNEDPAKSIEDLSLLGSLQDRDALYNTMFYSPAFYATNGGDWQGYYGGSGRYGYVWPGPSTELTFENGTIVEYKTIARVVGDFSGISNGRSFYDKYCSGSTPVAQVATPTTPSPTASATSIPVPTPLGYPPPVIIASDESAAGYFLSDSDVAVLALLTYAPAVPAEFQLVVETFISKAKAAGKTKLVIDVSANGGGLIFQGHDTFRQLFPQIEQDAFNRFRSNELLEIASRQFSGAIPNGFNPEISPNATLIDIYEIYENYRFDVDMNLKHFTDFDAKFSLDTFNGDNFTQIHKWDFTDPLLTM